MYRRCFKIPKSSFFLFGARGTGKTHFLERNLQAQLSVELLSSENYFKYSTDPGLFRRQLETLKPGNWVWIDEVQRLPTLLNEVHWGIEKRKLKFALSGSSSRKLRQAGVNLLGGRALSKQFFPLLPEELGNDFNLEQALKTGSIPLILSAPSVKEGIRAYIHSYVREEVQAEAYVKDLPSFARFLKVAAVLHGQTLNLSSVSRDAGVKRTTLENYFSILEDTQLANRLYPYEANLRVRERHHPKFYWIDPGIVRGLKEEWGDLTTHDRGPLFEGWVYTVLRAYQSYFDLFDEIFYWGSASTEVDFLIKKDGYFYAIETKTSSRFRPEDATGLRSIASLPKLKKRILLYSNSIDRQKTEDGIEILGIDTFLELLKTKNLFG